MALQCLDRTDIGMPLLPASCHSPASHPVTTFRTTSKPANTQVFSTITPYCRTTTSSQIHQHYFTEVEATVNRPASLHLRPPTPTSLGFYFDHEDVTMEGVGHFFCKLAKKKHEGSKCPLKTQSQRGGLIVFQDVLTPPHGEWAKLRVPQKGPWPWRRTRTRPFGSAGLSSTCSDPHPCDFLENHFRGEEVKLIKKMGYT